MLRGEKLVPLRYTSKDGEGADRENQHHAMERRTSKNRPTLRNHVGQCQGHKRGEHPDRKKYQQDSGIIATARMEHQTERARGPRQYRDQGRRAQEAREPIAFLDNFRIDHPPGIAGSTATPIASKSSSPHIRIARFKGAI